MTKIEGSQHEVAELVAQLGRVVYGSDFGAGFTAAQWTTLHYFSHANRFSRTVSAFAAYHGTTRGTASQTIKRLVERGYLSRSTVVRDGRSKLFDLTDEGRVLLRDDPFQAVLRVLKGLPQGMCESLAHPLRSVMHGLAEVHNVGLFGACEGCRFLQPPLPAKPCPTPWWCARFDECVEKNELNLLCANFESGHR